MYALVKLYRICDKKYCIVFCKSTIEYNIEEEKSTNLVGICILVLNKPYQMPPKINTNSNLILNIYTIRFREKANKQFVKIKDVIQPNDFESEIKKFKNWYIKTIYNNNNKDRLLYLQKILSQKPKYISGVFKKGHNGQETDIDEFKNNKVSTVGNVKSEQFNSSSFYFLLGLPHVNSDYLIFVAQSNEGFGFKDIFRESYELYIENKFPNKYTCYIQPLTVPKLFNTYLQNGEVRGFKFKKHELPQNMENLLGPTDNNNPKDYEVVTTVKAKKKGFFDFKKNDYTKTPFLELFDLEDDYDEVYADVSVNGRKRSINLTNIEKFTASFDVTDKVKLERGTKKPVFKDMDAEAINLLHQELQINLK